MATRIWQGGAPAVSQVTDWTFSGTWASSSSTVTFTIGTRSVSVVIGSTTISTIVDNLVSAWNALSSTNYPEFAEMTASKDGTTDLRLTADTGGKPFAVSLSTNDGTGVIGSATAISANSGANDWSTAANWSGAAVPANTDDVIIENNDVDILYGLDQNAVDLTTLTIKQSFTGKIGLPIKNADGDAEYYEYRQRDLKIGSTAITIGQGEGGGSAFINIDGDSTVFTAIVYNTGESEDSTRAAVRLRGTNTSNVLHVLKGSVDFAYEAGDAASGLGTVNVAYRDNVAGDAKVRIGPAATPLTTINIRGGTLELNSDAVTITQTDGELTLRGSMTVTTHHLDGGTCYDMTSGTVTTLNVGDGGIIDYRRDTRAKTVTTINVYAGATVLDPYKRVTFTNSVVLVRCALEDVTLDLGVHITLART